MQLLLARGYIAKSTTEIAKVALMKRALEKEILFSIGRPAIAA
jgi:hypothetical protein